jgi:hypothetical protein
MIDLNVSLASSGNARISGYEQLLRMGYAQNAGIYRILVDAGGEWSGLAIRAFWHTPGGTDPPASLVVDGIVTVPALVTAKPGNGCITFEGTDGGKLIASADVLYRVGSNSGTTGGTEPDPEPGAWQQFVDAVKGSSASAVQAAKDAAASAASADTSAGAADRSAQSAAGSAAAAESSESAAGQSAQAASESAAEATRQATLAAQTAESKGYLYLEDHDNSGTLSLVIADSIADEITLRDNGAGVLEVVYQ